MALGNQIVLVSGGLKIVSRHTIGANRNRLKSCGTYRKRGMMIVEGGCGIS